MHQVRLPLFARGRNLPRKPIRKASKGARPEFRFCFSDNWTFSRETSPPLTVAPDFRHVSFEADLAALSQPARRPLSPREADFAWLALAVYLADRTAPRHPYGSNGPEFWRRRIHVHLPVRNQGIWEKAAGELVSALEFLTEDDWSFEFLPGRAAFEAERQEHFQDPDASPVAWTSLFSGGLDSLAGAIHWLRKELGLGLLVSGQTHNRIAAGQQGQANELGRRFQRRVAHAGIRYGLPDKRGMEGFESSQRARAFIHTALGAIAALRAGTDRLFLFENGFGALNLPCDSAQFGSQNSRGTHPIFLRRMSAVVGAVFEAPSFLVSNPFLFLTKAEMLSGPDMRPFEGLLHRSFSCDRFPNYRQKIPQCGRCASCLIRRLAFHESGLDDDPNGYACDVFRAARSLRESELLALTKLSIQAETLGQSLRGSDPWPGLCARWPDLLRAQSELGRPDFKKQAIGLLRRHVSEWESFSLPLRFHPLALAA